MAGPSGMPQYTEERVANAPPFARPFSIVMRVACALGRIAGSRLRPVSVGGPLVVLQRRLRLVVLWKGPAPSCSPSLKSLLAGRPAWTAAAMKASAHSPRIG